MIVKETPKEINKYIKVDNKIGRFLQGKNIHPLFMDKDFLYFEDIQIVKDALLEYDKVVKKTSE